MFFLKIKMQGHSLCLLKHMGEDITKNFYLAQALNSLMPSPMCSTLHIHRLLKNVYGRWYDIWFYTIFKGSEDTYMVFFVMSLTPNSNVMLVFLLYLCCEQIYNI